MAFNRCFTLTNPLKYLYYKILITRQDSKVKIRVADITEKIKAIETVEEVASFPTLLESQAAGECQYLSPVKVSLGVVREYDHIRVHGTVGTKVGLLCSRCLSEFIADLSSTFTIFYTKAVADQAEDEVELGELELISAPYSGDEIDFTNEIAEQILLEIPYKPLCSEECHGLCASCGTDLNNSDCTCSSNAASMAFSSLKGLKVKH